MESGKMSKNGIFAIIKKLLMKKIGILSDTHGYWDDRYLKYFEDCNEIWHAGDIGSLAIIYKLGINKICRAVHGNADGQEIRREYPKHLRFKVEEVDIWLTHIGGYPGRYAPDVIPEIYENPPKLFVCGHSHILKVQYDKKLDLLHINPGAAGKQGWHTVRTLVRLTIDGKEMKDLEVIEMN